MSRYGFIHDRLDIKILVLYIAARLPGAVPLDVLTDLALCDDGVDYFEYSTCLADLVRTGHLEQDAEERYSITEKGRETSEICESSLAYSIRMKVERSIAPHVRQLQRSALIKTDLSERQDGNFAVKLSLDDGIDNILTMEILAGRREHADLMMSNFSRGAEKIFNRILDVLTDEY